MSQYLLEMQHISKEFYGVKALKDVSLDAKEGEILAVVGENGAGKSTLMNILSGVYPHGSYGGTFYFNGKECVFHKIKDSEKEGIVIIHQELALVPTLSIAENIFLGNERAEKGVMNWAETTRQAAKLLERVALKDDPATLIKDIGIGKQQLVEIAKALGKKVKLLILDEPTAALNDKDSKYLLEILLDLKKTGITSIIISHKLNEVCYVADRITVIRDGISIETMDKTQGEFSEDRIIKGMVGRDLSERYPARKASIGEVVFEVEDWSCYHPTYQDKNVVDKVSIQLRRGEVVGIYGLMGAGRTEFAMSVFGRSYGCKASGIIRMNGKVIQVDSVQQAIANKIAYIPEDRKEFGLNLKADIKMNISSAGLQKISKGMIVDNEEDILVAKEYCEKLGIKSSGIYQKVENLSGGNQQKVVLAKWVFTQPDVLLLDEPTRGVDVGAKYEIYSIINSLAEEGKSALFISSDLAEILGMCDRIYIMNEGRLVGEMSVEDATQEQIMQCIVRQTTTGGTAENG